jgi:membrane protease YdiL (CAAX protease family)
MVLSVVILIVASIAGGSLGWLVAPLTPSAYPDTGGWLLANALKVALATALLVVWARVVDRRRIADYGFSRGREWWTELFAGMLIGASIPIVSVLVMFALGWASVSSVASPSAPILASVAIGLISALGIGYWEETLYRGIAFKNAAEGLRAMRAPARGAVLGAWFITSLGFTLYHVLLGGGLASFGYYMTGSLLLGLGYLLTGRLALPIGLHAMYDFFHGLVFVPNPEPSFPALVGLRMAESAPDAFVGQVGLLEVGFIALAMALVLAWVRRRDGRDTVRTELAEWIPRGAR